MDVRFPACDRLAETVTLEDESRLSFYRIIAALNEEHGVFLVQHTGTKRVFVKKSQANL